jgi:hypothetical protein
MTRIGIDGGKQNMSDQSLKRAQRGQQIGTLIQEQFEDIAPTEEEIATIEAEALNDPMTVMEWVLLTNRDKGAVNMLYMSIQALNLRLRHEPKKKSPATRG